MEHVAPRIRSPALSRAAASTPLLAVVYHVAAGLGPHLRFGQTRASPVWPPSGIALAAIYSTLHGPEAGRA